MTLALGEKRDMISRSDADDPTWTHNESAGSQLVPWPPPPTSSPAESFAVLLGSGCHRACSSRNAVNITRTIFGSSSPRCASVNDATLVDDGRGSAEDEALELVLVHRAGLRLEPGSLQQLAHAGSDDAMKLAGVRDHALLQSVGRLLQQGPIPFAASTTTSWGQSSFRKVLLAK